jgi:predicted flap endonuclease-1-like 5' DNA nuclease
MTKLAEIEGIGPVYSAKLEQAGITSVESLLSTCCDKKGRKKHAQTLDISEKLLLSWVNRADLARINGINTQYADLLEEAGVDTVPELAQRNADNLHAKMAEVNSAKKLVRQMPSLAQVQGWISQATELPRVMTY